LKSFVSDAEDTFRYHSGNRSLIPPYVSSFSSGGNFFYYNKITSQSIYEPINII